MKNFLKIGLLISLIVVMFSSFEALSKQKGKGGNQIMPVEYYGQVSSATSGAAALVFSVPGLKASTECVITVKSLGTGPAYAKATVVTADTITVTMDANQTGGSTVINYVCFKP